KGGGAGGRTAPAAAVGGSTRRGGRFPRGAVECATCTGDAMASSGRPTPHGAQRPPAYISARTVGDRPRRSSAGCAALATCTGTGPAASARPSGGSDATDDGADLSDLWAGLCAPAASGGAVLHVRYVLAAPRGRAPAGSALPA